jgi:hypothetical protein
MKILQLGRALEASYAPDTSYFPGEWDPNNPAFGHSGIVPLIVQDHVRRKETNPDFSLEGNCDLLSC